MIDLLEKFEKKNPEIIFEWNDNETDAKGWIVINSLRGGAAAGGTRMRIGVTKEEVIALAKTMEIKFTVSGPKIGGGKSGINFNPHDPRKKEVLKRWYKAASPLLKNCYGTGGDMNVDEVDEVIPICKENGILFPLEGVIRGHYKKNSESIKIIVNQLNKGVPLIVKNDDLTPSIKNEYTVGDLITGYGVSESIVHYYNIYGGNLKSKRVIIQGWGNVAAAAAYYLSKEGASIVGIIDKNGGLINQKGFSYNEIKELFINRESNSLKSEKIISFEETNEKIWSIGAEIFVPAAASRLLNQKQLDEMIENNLELISSGANVPFADKEIFFGPISKNADQQISVIPDFIANCGMARAFSYCMTDNIKIDDVEIFKSVSKTIKEAIQEVYNINRKKTSISRAALEIALKKLN